MRECDEIACAGILRYLCATHCLDIYIWLIIYLGLRLKMDMMADAEQEYNLSREEVEHFVQHGWLKLSSCFTREQADVLQKTLWTRLGMEANDMSTW
ncbi:hypothetical protein BDU57DRAFT_508788 [Ampelomyces quisqualis]|uniref:Uncharacterized protein n=1 Tax=Ampelomyces quisqualis TaxID=50730 RepID=A0A6A5R310_AMPQU|nr:hypothetical protein BDU57DRAFT_508788 [Ampelomyces quisqualis]